jgi:hypothetical protein
MKEPDSQKILSIPFENLEKTSFLAMKDNFHSDEILKKYGCSEAI